MKEIVRNDPAAPVGKAIRTIRIKAADEYSADEDFYKHLIPELGTDSVLEKKQMLRVRAGIIGPTPSSRNILNPVSFLDDIYGDNHGIIG